jgi:hypothetical protein
MHLIGAEGHEIPGTVYGKVVGAAQESSADFSVRFTSMPPEIETFLHGLLGRPDGETLPTPSSASDSGSAPELSPQ